MILKGSDPNMLHTKIYDAWGCEIDLPIKQYDTETEEAVIFIPVKSGKSLVSTVARTPKKDIKHGDGWECQVATAKIKIPGSYAEIKGVKIKKDKKS